MPIDVAEWLKGLQLAQYTQAFRDNDVDAAVLPNLTAEDLRELGVASIGHRRRLLDAIAALRESAPSPAPEVPSQSLAEAERRQLTVIFCDLVGSTTLATQLDPEDLRAVIGAYHRTAATTVERFHGFVAQFLGDGVLIYFGYPEAREDDAEQAVRCALALASAAPALSAQRGVPLEVRLGIATGLVVVGDIAGGEPKIMGETPNLAARLQALAAPGAVVIAESTRRLVGRHFACDDLGPMALKGFAEPQRVWRVIGERVVEGRFDALRSSATPLVGREEELDLLLRRWEQVKTGAGRVVLLSGEPGIGKSRLSSALRERIAGESHRRISYFCAPHRQESALFPIVEQLERAAGFEREDDDAAKCAKLVALLEPCGLGGGESVALFAELLSLRGGLYPALDLTPQQKKARTLQALVELVAALAAREPLLMHVEDIHWIDPSSRELLDLIVDRVQTVPVLLIVTFRPEFVPPWSGRAHVTLLALNRLGAQDGESVLAAIAGDKSLPPEIAAQIIARTDGVPLFIEELTKAVIESGQLREEGGRWTLDGALPSLAIPTTLQSSLMARLDRLAPAREVAQIGAAIGRQFSHALVSAVARMSEDRLGEALKRLADAELIFVRGVPPEAEYTFKHALVQDAAYATLLRERRQELHARIAAALERGGGVAPELLAHHLTAAGDAMRAAGYWLAAGRRGAQRSANAEAIAHFGRGIGALETLPETPERTRLELELRLALGPTLQGLWRLAEADANLARAHELGLGLGDERARFRVVWGQWLSTTIANDTLGRRAKLADDLFAIARPLADPGLMLQAHHAAWPTSLQAGDLVGAMDHIRSGLGIYDIEKHRDHATIYAGHDPGVCGLGFSSACLWLLGYPDQATERLDQSCALTETLAHLPTRSLNAAMWMPFYTFTRRAFDIAAREAERSITLGRDLGVIWVTSAGTMLRGWSRVRQGDVEGVAEQRRGLEMFLASRVSVLLSFHKLMLADSYLTLRDTEAGLCAIAEAMMKASVNEYYMEAEIHRLEGELRLLGNDRAAAEQSFQRALALARGSQAKSLELRAATSLARLWGESRRRSKALDLLAPVYGWFGEGFDTPDLTDAKALLDALA